MQPFSEEKLVRLIRRRTFFEITGKENKYWSKGQFEKMNLIRGARLVLILASRLVCFSSSQKYSYSVTEKRR